MKSFLKSLIVLFFTFTSVMVFAQEQKPAKPKKTPQEKAEILTKKMDETLNLSDEQTAKVMKINVQLHEEIAKYKTEAGKKSADAKLRIKEARDVAAQQLKSVLSAEQFKKYQQWEEARISKKRHHGKEHGQQDHDHHKPAASPSK